jgi:hypothetical protein
MIMAALLLAACGGEPAARPAAAASGTCSVSPEDTVHSSKSPGDLVREYHHWNTSGVAFLGAQDHLEDVFECHRLTAGSPRYVVAEGFVAESTVTGDSARFVLRWDVLGTLTGSGGGSGELRFTDGATVVTDTLHLRRRPWGWRIVGCCAGVFLEPTAPLEVWGLSPDDQDAIEDRFFTRGENDSAAAERYRAQLLNAQFSRNGVQITLRDGSSGTSDGGSITLGGVIAADLDADGDLDALASLEYLSTGTSSSEFLVAYRFQDGQLAPAGAVVLGHPRYWMVRRGIVYAVDRDWAPEDPHCCPTVRVWLGFVVRGDSLVRQ